MTRANLTEIIVVLDRSGSMAAFCSAVNFLCVLVIGILQESGYVNLISGNSTF